MLSRSRSFCAPEFELTSVSVISAHAVSSGLDHGFGVGESGVSDRGFFMYIV